MRNTSLQLKHILLSQLYDVKVKTDNNNLSQLNTNSILIVSPVGFLFIIASLSSSPALILQISTLLMLNDVMKQSNVNGLGPHGAITIRNFSFSVSHKSYNSIFVYNISDKIYGKRLFSETLVITSLFFIFTISVYGLLSV